MLGGVKCLWITQSVSHGVTRGWDREQFCALTHLKIDKRGGNFKDLVKSIFFK